MAVLSDKRGDLAAFTVKRCGRFAMAKTVLVVEDNSLNMKLFLALLHAAGYDTLACANGVDGESVARRERPALVVLDIQLPDIPCTEVARRLKNDPSARDVPILAVTAFALAADRDAVLASGCDHYLSKPFMPTQFIEKVLDLIGPP